jgi:hypothetical protein
LAVVLIVALGALTVAVGVRAGYREVDADELVYRRTLVSMQHGSGYYSAMRAALVRKEGAPPSQVRSVRPPTMFLLLRPFPPSSWRWLVGAVYFGVLVLAWRLSRPLAPWAGPVGVGLASLWLLGAAPLLFLHSELWGLPFLLGGALAMRRRQWALAAVLLLVAVTFRETYVVAFAAGLLWAERRRPFVVAAVVLAGLVAIHVWLAQAALSAHGHENALRNGTLGASFILNAVSPVNGPWGWAAGLVGVVFGGAGIVWRWRTDHAARILGITALILVPAAIAVGRDYWSLTYGVGVACFVPAGVTLVASERTRASSA